VSLELQRNTNMCIEHVYEHDGNIFRLCVANWLGIRLFICTCECVWSLGTLRSLNTAAGGGGQDVLLMSEFFLCTCIISGMLEVASRLHLLQK
jgi:hypothetical protein